MILLNHACPASATVLAALLSAAQSVRVATLSTQFKEIASKSIAIPVAALAVHPALLAAP